MKIEDTKIEGLKIIHPDVYVDERGYFSETYSKKKLQALGIDCNFVQDNESMSQKGVLRGLHFQKPPFAQDKLVRVIRGAVWDVAVDIRKNSKTYGQWVAVELSEENHLQFFLPKGMAHGFLALRDNTIFAYKVSDFYEPSSEGGLQFNDRDLGVKWPFKEYEIQEPSLSRKDQEYAPFKDFVSMF